MTEDRTRNGATPDAETRRALNKKHARSGLYVLLRALLCGILKTVHRIRVVGRENEPKRGDGSYLVICNHANWRDPIFLCIALRQQQPHFMAKKELFRIPLFNLLIKALGAYPVDRGGADVGAIRRTISMLEHGTTVGMFPQGHRYNGEDPRTTPVRSGAAMIALKAGVPILPVYIKVKDHTMKPFCKKEIFIGKPISPEEMGYDPTCPGEYQRIADMLFERVCTLGDQTAE